MASINTGPTVREWGKVPVVVQLCYLTGEAIEEPQVLAGAGEVPKDGGELVLEAVKQRVQWGAYGGGWLRLRCGEMGRSPLVTGR